MSESPDLSRTAQDHLKVIRQLMERATVYRVISAVPALLTGLVAIGVAAYVGTRPEGSLTSHDFILIWLGVYVAVDLFNAWMLFREAKNRGAPFPSPQLIHAALLMVPPMGVLGMIGVVEGWSDGLLVHTALFWAMGYGLALVGMRSFAPRSILSMGWAFVAVAAIWFLLGASDGDGGGSREDLQQACVVMGSTFGGIHVIYGAVMLVMSRRQEG